jgi:hypothetical protein
LPRELHLRPPSLNIAVHQDAPVTNTFERSNARPPLPTGKIIKTLASKILTTRPPPQRRSKHRVLQLPQWS